TDEELSKGCKRKTSKIPKKKPVNLLTDWHYPDGGFFYSETRHFSPAKFVIVKACSEWLFCNAI
ncbi:hypothetical protein NI451_14540, partial [Acinetobacter indicus]|nr:hypothetical protein [Acinetobacter indicus]